MSDLISRADAIELCADAQGRASTKSELKGISRIWQGLLKLPSAETTGALDDAIAKYVADGLMELPSTDRPSGEWIGVTNGRGGHECSNCHAYAPSYMSGNEYLSNYCPSCGARMKGGEDE